MKCEENNWYMHARHRKRKRKRRRREFGNCLLIIQNLYKHYNQSVVKVFLIILIEKKKELLKHQILF